jgi:uncharacterized damage-inducible protein DinB
MFTREGMAALHRWTHRRLDDLLWHAAGLPPGLFTRKVDGFGHGNVRDQMLHMLAAEAYWVRALQDLPDSTPPQPEYLTVEDVARRKQQVLAATLAYLESLTEEQLNAELDRRPQGWIGPLRSPAFILHHIATHAFHHKGQVAAMFRLLGHPLGDTDLQRERGDEDRERTP